MKKFVRLIVIVIAAMLVNDVIQTVLAYRKFRKKMQRQAIARLRRNRRRAEKRRRAKRKIRGIGKRIQTLNGTVKLKQ